MAVIAEEGHEVVVTTVFAFDTSKAVMQITAFEIAINDLLRIRSPETILPGEMILSSL